MALLVAFLLAAVVALVVRLALDQARFRRLELAIPGPASLPLLGSLQVAVGVTPDTFLATFLRLWDRRHDQLWRVSVLGHLIVVVSDPDHLRELLTRKDLVDKDPFVYKFFRAVANGLLVLNGEHWRAHRRALQPAFHQSVLDRYTPVFADEALAYVRRVRPGESQDVADNLQAAFMRSFLRTSLASSDQGEGADELRRLLPDIQAVVSAVSHSFSHRVAHPWLWSDAVFFGLTPTGRNIRRLTVKVDAFCRRLFAARRAELQRQRADGVDDDDDAPSKHRSLLDILLEPGDKLSLSDEEILVEFKTFMGAAIDTASSTLSWTLKALSLRHDVQAGVHGARHQGDDAPAARRPVRGARRPRRDGVLRTHAAGRHHAGRQHPGRAPRPAPLARPAALRPGPLPARAQPGPPPLRLPALQRGAAQLHRRQARHDGHEDAAGHAGAALPHRPRRRRLHGARRLPHGQRRRLLDGGRGARRLHAAGRLRCLTSWTPSKHSEVTIGHLTSK